MEDLGRMLSDAVIWVLGLTALSHFLVTSAWTSAPVFSGMAL